MEVALNLSWLVVTCLLFASVWVAHARGKLHLSLKLALACTAVLALLLFPAISMTDDLQQAQLLCEGHWAGVPDTVHETLAVSFGNAMGLLSLLLIAMATYLLVLLARLYDARHSLKSLRRQQPSAVRPPPFSFCLQAA